MRKAKVFHSGLSRCLRSRLIRRVRSPVQRGDCGAASAGVRAHSTGVIITVIGVPATPCRRIIRRWIVRRRGRIVIAGGIRAGRIIRIG